MNDSQSDKPVLRAVGNGAKSAFRSAAIPIITFLLGFYGPGLLTDVFGGPTALGEQYDAIAHEASLDGYGISSTRIVHGLHGEGLQSMLMVLSDRRDQLQEPYQQPRPDEFRIYDEVQKDGSQKWVERFAFRPSLTLEVGHMTSWRFEVRRVSDLNRDGEVDVVADFTEDRADEATYRPVLIHWEDSDEQYKMIALIPKRPVLAHYSGAGIRTAGFRREYQQPERLSDHARGIAVSPYAASEFAVRGSLTGVTTLAAFFLSVGGPRMPVVELVNYDGSLFGSTAVPECDATVWRLNTSVPLTEPRIIAAAHKADLTVCV